MKSWVCCGRMNEQRSKEEIFAHFERGVGNRFPLVFLICVKPKISNDAKAEEQDRDAVTNSVSGLSIVT